MAERPAQPGRAYWQSRPPNRCDPAPAHPDAGPVDGLFTADAAAGHLAARAARPARVAPLDTGQLGLFHGPALLGGAPSVGWNRITTDTLLEHELQRGRRSGAPVTFVLLDLDHFKQVNDLYGHRTGDAVLRGFAQTVRGRLRGSDVLGRTGGEEFGLVLPDTDLAGARWLVDDVRRAVEAMAVPNSVGQPVRVTVSAGLAVADPKGSVSGDRLYGHADQALYEAKRGGRNRVEAYGISTGASALLPLGD